MDLGFSGEGDLLVQPFPFLGFARPVAVGECCSWVAGSLGDAVGSLGHDDAPLMGVSLVLRGVSLAQIAVLVFHGLALVLFRKEEKYQKH